MKAFCQILLLISLLASACRPAGPEVIESADVEDLPPFDPATQQAMARLSLEHSIHFIESNPEAVLLDVRGRKEYDKAHISKAVSFPYNPKNKSMAKALNSNPDYNTKKVYFLYGSKDNFYAIEIALRFMASGHQHIFIMNGGIEDWIKKGLPVMSSTVVE